MLDERGALKKVVSFNDYIYIFRDYGITRLSAYADQSSFYVSQLFVSSGKIYPNSVCVCGDEIIFLASDGLYSFNGINTTKILDNISLGFLGQNNEKSMATYLENKYYLACKFNFQDGTVSGEINAENNCVIEVDLLSRTALFLRGADVCHISAIKTDKFEGVVVCAKAYGENAYKLGAISYSGKIFNAFTTKVWQTPFSDLGYTGQNKTILDMLVQTKNSLSVVLKNEKQETKTLAFNGQARAQKIKTRFSGEKISFRFETNNSAENIISPTVKINIGQRGA